MSNNIETIGNQEENKPNQWEEAMADIDETTVPFEKNTEISDNDAEQNRKWTKVGDQMGSNPGGWYIGPDRDKYYAKFYNNPDQGKVEFIANSIYWKLGIKAAESELVDIDGREAVISLEIPRAMRVSKEAQKNSLDVQNGFVADAYLANWDVAGLTFDNIMRTPDGFYRIDNGGSLIFRAKGGDKDYSPDSIPELKTMLDPNYTAGEVFSNISERTILSQARKLLNDLSVEDIKKIVAQSGLKGENRERVLSGLIGRRNYLERLCNMNSRSRNRGVIDAMREVNSFNATKTGETMEFSPKTEVICDRDHIEDQRMDIIKDNKDEIVNFSFKLRKPTNNIIAITSRIPYLEDEPTSGQKTLKDRIRNFKNSIMRKETTPSGAVLKRGVITYESSSSDKSFHLCDAAVFKKDGIKFLVGNPSLRNREKGPFVKNGPEMVRSAMGMIKVEIPADMDPNKVEKIVNSVLANDLGIPDVFTEVNPVFEKKYKMARYAWQHVIDGDLTEEQIKKAEQLNREEVFPGYTTFVEHGKHIDYLGKYGEDLRAVHRLRHDDAQAIYRVLTMGLMSTTERFSRGALVEGISSTIDIDTGGADSVFTRILNEEQRNNAFNSVTYVVFRPEVFDRTDWYAYDTDMYGSTEEEKFQQRLSPDALFDEVSKYDARDNEQMFRTGIGPDYIESILVDRHYRKPLLESLKKMGLNKIGDRRIEDVILARHPMYEDEDEDEGDKYLDPFDSDFVE